ncbi:MAG: HAD family hydrolase [Candidatus Bathyarchaeia archaeon]
MINAVTLDLWNTLFTEKNYTDFRVNYLEVALKEHNITRNHDEVLGAYDSARELARKIRDGEDHRHLTVDEGVDYILERIGVDLPVDVKTTLVKRFEEALWEDPPALKEGVVETLKVLRPRYRLGIISDAGTTPGRVLRDALQELKILNFFSSTVFSNEVGFCKPHRAMFEASFNELGVKPHEAVHVGDLLHTDVAGAKAMGMKAIWVKTMDLPGAVKWKPDYEVTELPQVVAILDEMDER